MTIKNMVEITWAEDLGQFLYHLDPDTRKITRRLKKLQLKMGNSVPSYDYGYDVAIQDNKDYITRDDD